MPKRKIIKTTKRNSTVSQSTKMSYSIGHSKSNFKIKLSESYLSLILGFLVVLVGAILIFTFSKNKTYDRINTAASTYQELTTPTQNDDKKGKTYVVAAGDSLWTIAEKVYGSGYNWVDLTKANKLSDPSLIYAGTKLTIPDVPKIVVQNSENSMSNSPPSITSSTYTIQEEDYLWDISIRAFGDGYKWPEIVRINSIPNPDLIYAGSVLKLPR